MIWALLLIPTAAGIAALFIRPDWPRRVLLLATALAHAGLTASGWVVPFAPAARGWLAADAASILFLSITSALFLAAAFYAVGYLHRERRLGPDIEEGFLFTNCPEATFTGCLLLFLASMTLVIVSRHLGLIWVAVEATTLASAPLIYFHRHHRSLEATWKYLLICSVGIAIALLGNFFIAAASHQAADHHVSTLIDDLAASARQLNPAWLKAAFLLLLVGYGTKMGLAPLHTWLPDAHSEAPSVISALLSGALLNCAFLAILRMHSVVEAAGLGDYSRRMLLTFGLLSMGVAALFIIGQADYKRILAYSSVEHMGILALGVGIGGVSAFGSMLHSVNHSLAKAMLFLTAGNILAAYKTKSSDQARGVLKVLPISGILWVAGFLAITGTPPFGPFLSELTILKGAVIAGRWVVAAAYLLMLAVVFVAMAQVFLRMAYGQPPGALKTDGDLASAPRGTEPLWSWLPAAALGMAVLMLGVYVPPALNDLLHQAAIAVGAN